MLALIGLIGISIQRENPWVIDLLLVLFCAGIVALCVNEQFRRFKAPSRIFLTVQGLHASRVWGGPREIPWTMLSRVESRHSRLRDSTKYGRLQLHTADGTVVTIYTYIKGFAALEAALKAHVPYR